MLFRHRIFFSNFNVFGPRVSDTSWRRVQAVVLEPDNKAFPENLVLGLHGYLWCQSSAYRRQNGERDQTRGDTAKVLCESAQHLFKGQFLLREDNASFHHAKLAIEGATITQHSAGLPNVAICRRLKIYGTKWPWRYPGDIQPRGAN